MYLVDTHQHLWDPRQIPCSWCAGIPALNRSFNLDDYRSASACTAISKSVFVECDVDDPYQLAEAELIQRLAEQNPLIAGMVASGRPENPGFPSYLEKLTALTKLRGLRRVLHVVPDAVSRQSLFRENLQRLPAYNLTFDICALARQLPVARELVDACPKVTFILDHCGVPDVKARAFDPWREEIRALAERANVNCKISGLVAYADPTSWTTADLRPWVEHVIECFGWNRIVWGGDWPVCTLSSTLSRWVATAHELTAGATTGERANFFHLNAERLYRV